uniref:Putative conserved secreted protein n=1 Tax=Lutzomyia longipalpis TaxID=7200 RepID=A0A1B0CGM9_LUTLO
MERLFGSVALAVLLQLCVFIDYAAGVKCYRCTVAPSARLNQTMLCAKFDESSYCAVECPYSTMCMKKIFRLKLMNGQEVETVTRDCAQQKRTDEVFRNGRWEKESTIEEAYEEGCETIEENKSTQSMTVFCHCRGSLCNSAPKETLVSYHVDAMAVILVFNAMKYFQSID